MFRLPSQQKFKPNKKRVPPPNPPGPSSSAATAGPSQPRQTQDAAARPASQAGPSGSMPGLSQGGTQSTQDTFIATPREKDHLDPTQSPRKQPSTKLPSPKPPSISNKTSHPKPPSTTKNLPVNTDTLPGPSRTITKPSPRSVPLGLPPSVQTGPETTHEPSPPARGPSLPPLPNAPSSSSNRNHLRTPGPRPSITPDFRGRDTMSPGARRSMTRGGTFSPGGRGVPGGARKGPSALLQAARVHAEQGFSRPSPGRIPPRSARSKSSRAASATPAPDDDTVDEIDSLRPVAGPSKLPEPAAATASDLPTRQDKVADAAAIEDVAPLAEVSETSAGVQELPDRTPASTGVSRPPIVQRDSTPAAVLRDAEAAALSDEEIAIERRRRMMARITGEAVGAEGEAAIRRSRSRQSTPVVPIREESPRPPSPSQAAETRQVDEQQPPSVERQASVNRSPNPAQQPSPNPATAVPLEADAASPQLPVEDAVEEENDDVDEAAEADEEADATRTRTRKHKSAEGLFMRQSSSPEATPSVYQDSLADFDSVTTNEGDDAGPSHKRGRNNAPKGIKGTAKKSSKSKGKQAEGDEDGDKEASQVKPKRKRAYKKKTSANGDAVVDGDDDGAVDDPAPRKKKRKSPATLAEGVENVDQTTEVVSKPKRAKKEAKPKTDRVRFLQPSMEELQNGGIMEEEVDINVLTMADLATKVTHGRVSERAGVLAMFHQELKKQRKVKTVHTNWARWERQQIIRRKLRALKNDIREARREEARHEGRNPDDDVSADEEDSEEEFEIIPDRLTPPEEEERVMRIQPPRLEEPGEGMDGVEGGEVDGEAGEEGEAGLVGEHAEGEDDAERPFLLDPLVDDPDDVPAEEPVEEDELAGFGHREDDEDLDEDDETHPRNEAGEVDWDRLQEENEEGGDWADSRDQLQEAIRRGEDTREVHEAQSATRLINQNTFRRGKAAARWNHDETEFFYEVALPSFGENPFSLQSVFPGRTQAQLKKKMLREAKLDPERYVRAISKRVAIDKEYLSKAAGMDAGTDFDAEIAFLQQCKEDVAMLKRLDAGEVINDHAVHEQEPDDGLQRFDEEGYGDGKEDENEKMDDRWEGAGEDEEGYDKYDDENMEVHDWANEGGGDKEEEEEEDDIDMDDFRDEVAA